VAKNKTLYLPDAAEPVWDAAERVARKRGIKLGPMLTALLEENLPRLAEEPDPRDRWAQIAADQPAA
jgi:hypothetical protein